MVETLKYSMYIQFILFLFVILITITSGGYPTYNIEHSYYSGIEKDIDKNRQGFQTISIMLSFYSTVLGCIVKKFEEKVKVNLECTYIRSTHHLIYLLNSLLKTKSSHIIINFVI